MSKTAKQPEGVLNPTDVGTHAAPFRRYAERGRQMSLSLIAGVNARKRDYMRVEWVSPARGHIHPGQEVAAVGAAISAGLLSRKRGVALMGDDVEKIDLENARDEARSDKLELAYTVYPGADKVAPPPSDPGQRVKAIVEAEISETVERTEEEEAA